MAMKKTSCSFLLLLTMLVAQLQAGSALSDPSTHKRSLLTREHIRSSQRAACDMFCRVNPQITDSVTQGATEPVPMCNSACLTAIEKKTPTQSSPEAEPAGPTVSTAFPFVMLRVKPADLCPDVCKAGQTDATAIEQCNGKCIAAVASLSDDAASADSTSPAPAAPATDTPAVSGSLKVTYGFASLFATILFALF